MCVMRRARRSRVRLVDVLGRMLGLMGFFCLFARSCDAGGDGDT